MSTVCSRAFVFEKATRALYKSDQWQQQRCWWLVTLAPTIWEEKPASAKGAITVHSTQLVTLLLWITLLLPALVFCPTMSIVVVHVNDANLFPPCTAARVLFCPSVSIIVADVNYPSPIFFSVMSFIIRTVTLTDLILHNIAKYQNYAVKSRWYRYCVFILKGIHGCVQTCLTDECMHVGACICVCAWAHVYKNTT